jgi:hypothetical protein
VLNLNVTSDVVDGNNIVVDLRVEHRDSEAIVRSLERYGYVAIPITSQNDDDDTGEHEMSALERFLQI